MSSLARAIALFTGSSFIGTLTQIAKGKLSALILGADGVGILNQLVSLWSLFSVVAGMGFYNGIVRHLSQSWSADDRDNFSRQVSSSFIFLSFTSLMLAGAGCIFSAYLSHLIFADHGERAELICLILLSLPIFTAGQIYRAILNATRSVNHLVRARIAADVSSVVVLAILILLWDLRGAVLSYIGLHLLFLSFSIWFATKAVRTDLISPQPAKFDWSHIRKNAGYGLNGLIMVAAGILTTLCISRWIIEELGPAQNGIFSTAIKVGTVYLGALSAAASGYYFPTLVASKNNQELHHHINDALSLYFYIVPPIAVILMTGGDIMMIILFGNEFIPAAALLLLLLPGDLFRITSETLNLPLIAQNKLIQCTVLYITWALLYIFISYIMMPQFGIIGIAFAYLISHIINSFLHLTIAWKSLDYRMSARSILTILRGLLLTGTVALLLWQLDNRWIEYAASTTALIIWVIISMLDPRFRRMFYRSLNHVLPSRAKSAPPS